MKYNDAVKFFLKLNSVIGLISEEFDKSKLVQILDDLKEDVFSFENHEGLKGLIDSIMIDGFCEIESYIGKYDYYSTLILYQFMDEEFYLVRFQDDNYEYYTSYKEGYEEYENLIKYKESCEEDLEDENEDENEDEIENNSLDQIYLTSISPYFSKKIKCFDCGKEEVLSGYNKIITNKQSIYIYQYQCQSCGEYIFSDENSKDGVIVALKEKCKCGGQFRRDKNVFCSCGFRKTSSNKQEVYYFVNQAQIDLLNDMNGTPRDNN